MIFGKKPAKTPVEASGLTSQERQQLYFRVALLESRLETIEHGIVELCSALRQHIDRIDDNTKALDRNMHRLAELTLRPPKDLLNGSNEVN